MGLQWDKPSTNWCRISSIHSMGTWVPPNPLVYHHVLKISPLKWGGPHYQTWPMSMPMPNHKNAWRRVKQPSWGSVVAIAPKLWPMMMFTLRYPNVAMENHQFIDDGTIKISIYREFELPCLVTGDIRKLWLGVPKLADMILAFYAFPLRGSVSRKNI